MMPPLMRWWLFFVADYAPIIIFMSFLMPIIFQLMIFHFDGDMSFQRLSINISPADWCIFFDYLSASFSSDGHAFLSIFLSFLSSFLDEGLHFRWCGRPIFSWPFLWWPLDDDAARWCGIFLSLDFLISRDASITSSWLLWWPAVRCRWQPMMMYWCNIFFFMWLPMNIDAELMTKYRRCRDVDFLMSDADVKIIDWRLITSHVRLSMPMWVDYVNISPTMPMMYRLMAAEAEDFISEVMIFMMPQMYRCSRRRWRLRRW